MYVLYIYTYQFMTNNGRKKELLCKMAELDPIGAPWLQPRAPRPKIIGTKAPNYTKNGVWRAHTPVNRVYAARVYSKNRVYIIGTMYTCVVQP